MCAKVLFQVVVDQLVAGCNAFVVVVVGDDEVLR